jgi:hypothetical protein
VLVFIKLDIMCKFWSCPFLSYNICLQTLASLFVSYFPKKGEGPRSLEAYCAILWWRWLVSFVFPCNLAPMEWTWQGKTEVLGENPVPVSTTNPTWTDPGSNPGLRGERPATNRLSYGTAIFVITLRRRNLIGESLSKISLVRSKHR